MVALAGQLLLDKPEFIQLPPHLTAPYQVHDCGTDQYGYAPFEGNYYWVPGTTRKDVKILQYSDHIKIYLARECVAEYPLPSPSALSDQALQA